VWTEFGTNAEYAGSNATVSDGFAHCGAALDEPSGAAVIDGVACEGVLEEQPSEPMPMAAAPNHAAVAPSTTIRPKENLFIVVPLIRRTKNDAHAGDARMRITVSQEPALRAASTDARHGGTSSIVARGCSAAIAGIAAVVRAACVGRDPPSHAVR
jgi:hypothetical protein